MIIHHVENKYHNQISTLFWLNQRDQILYDLIQLDARKLDFTQRGLS